MSISHAALNNQHRQLGLAFDGRPSSARALPQWITRATRFLIDELAGGGLSQCGVIPWATPVPVFGNIMESRVATLSLNPSNLEFIDNSGQPLSGQSQRLETLASLRLSTWADVRAQDIRRVVLAYLHYFNGNPYLGWFQQLEELISPIGLGYNCGMCHLDLVPYATVDKWTCLTANQKSTLRIIGKESLASMLLNSPIQAVILNGSTVIRELESLSGIVFDRLEKQSWSLPRRSQNPVPGFSIKGRITRVGRHDLGRTVAVFGFNHNIQSSFGITRSVRGAIRRWLSSEMARVMS